MDATKFLKEKRRMCLNHPRCVDCPIVGMCRADDDFEAKKAVSTVEEWAEEHPVKTRASEFLKQFPNALLNQIDKFPIANPCVMDASIKERLCRNDFSCTECREKYWLEEIE